MNLNISTDYNSYTINKSKASILLNIKADELADDKKSDIGIIIVADRSGSMYGEKFELLKSSINKIVSNLSSNDIFSLITFDDKINIDYPLNNMKEENKLKINTIIKELKVGNTTNLSGGLFKAVEQINDYKTFNKDDNRSWNILLLTDGIANEGIVDPIKLTNFINKLIDSNPLISNTSIYTFGLGSDHNSELLKNISSCTNSNYYYLENKDMISTSFGDCLGGLLSIVVQNLELKLDVFDNYTIDKIYTNYKIKDNVIYIGDLYSEEEKNIIIDIDCNNIESDDILIDKCLKIKIDYFDLVNIKLISETINSTISREPDLGEMTINKTVLIQKFRLKAIELMNNMIKMNNIDLSKSIGEFKSELQKYELDNDEYCIYILQKMQDYLNKSKINKVNATHCLRSNVQEMCLERAATCDVNNINIYSTGRKNKLANVFSKC